MLIARKVLYKRRLLSSLAKRVETLGSFTTRTKYDEVFERSINPKTREGFWAEQAEEIDWFKKYDKVLNEINAPNYRWFSGGEINMSYNCIDRHVNNDLEDHTSIIWESAYLNMTKHITYGELMKNVCQLANFLKIKGIKKGDVVIVYMPMIPEALYIMLACTRIGAIHSVIFGGFAYAELATRIENSNAKLIVTASAGIEPKKTIPYIPIIDKALKSIKRNVPILMYQRDQVYKEDIHKYTEKIYVYQDEVSKMDQTCEPEILNSNDPLYLLYTSGSTGTPKGVIRDIGGSCVAFNYAMRSIYGVNKKDVFFSSSDIGWVVGHNYIVYGPLLRGATTVVFEGKPIGTPNAGKFWEIIQKHKVKSFFTSPTAMRAIRKEDENYQLQKKYDLSSMKYFHVAGEICDPNTFSWIQKSLNKGVLLNDNWWQTENGWPIASNNIEYHTFKPVPGSVCKPSPGYDLRLFDDDGKEVTEPNKLGNILIKLPMPPAFMTTLWGNNKAFVEKYLTNDYNYYITGDAGYRDVEGNVFIQSRIDDIINVAGHRLSTGRLEEVLVHTDGIVEAAVVGRKDELKGEVPFAFIVVRGTFNKEETDLVVKNGKEKIINEVGPIAKLNDIVVCHKLPKTKSGKLLRKSLRHIINKEKFKVPSTIEDETVVDDIIELVYEKKLIDTDDLKITEQHHYHTH